MLIPCIPKTENTAKIIIKIVDGIKPKWLNTYGVYKTDTPIYVFAIVATFDSTALAYNPFLILFYFLLSILSSCYYYSVVIVCSLNSTLLSVI